MLCASLGLIGFFAFIGQAASAQETSVFNSLQTQIQQLTSQIALLGSMIGTGQASTMAAVANADPKGYFDTATCDVFTGWTCDASDYAQSLTVHFYEDGLAGSGGTFIGATTANTKREAAVGNLCGGNSTHGFSYTIPASLKDGKQHTIYAYAINIPTGNNPLLATNAKTIKCAAPTCVAESQLLTASTQHCCDGLSQVVANVATGSNGTSVTNYECLKTGTAVCGNGTCEVSESATSCPQDCCHAQMNAELQAQIAALNAQLAYTPAQAAWQLNQQIRRCKANLTQ